MTWTDIQAFLAEHLAQFGITVVSSVGVAYAAFKHLAEKWLDNKFESKLEAARHAYAMAIAKAQISFDAQLKAHIRDQENDFKLLPEAWYLAGEAFGRLNWVVSTMQSWPRVGEMNNEELNELLKDSDFLETEKQRLRALHGRMRQQAYIEVEQVSRLNSVYKANRELMQFMDKHGILMPTSLRQDFNLLSTEVHNLSNRQMLAFQEVGENQSILWDHLNEVVRPIHSRIEQAIIDRLRAYASAPSQASNTDAAGE